MRSSVKPANGNRNDDLIGRTREIWQPRLGRVLGRDKAMQIGAGVTGFFAVLAERSRADRPDPTNDDREPSLSIRDAGGKLLGRCPAGCAQRDVIAALKARGLWRGKEHSMLRKTRRHKATPPRPDPDPEPDQPERSAVALSIWQSTIPADGTAVDPYLASHGLACLLPSSRRCHPGLKHPSGGIWPCMVALVKPGADGTRMAIHPTFLARESHGKPLVEPAKMMLEPSRRGAVHLLYPGEVLMIGESIETCPAAMQTTGHPRWAARMPGNDARRGNGRGKRGWWARSDATGWRVIDMHMYVSSVRPACSPWPSRCPLDRLRPCAFF